MFCYNCIEKKKVIFHFVIWFKTTLTCIMVLNCLSLLRLRYKSLYSDKMFEPVKQSTNSRRVWNWNPALSLQTQSFSRSYRSILLISLACIVPSTRGCLPLRPMQLWVRPDIGRHPVPGIFKGPLTTHTRHHESVLWIFKNPSRAHWTLRVGPPDFQGPTKDALDTLDLKIFNIATTIIVADPI